MLPNHPPLSRIAMADMVRMRIRIAMPTGIDDGAAVAGDTNPWAWHRTTATWAMCVMRNPVQNKTRRLGAPGRRVLVAISSSWF
jgi:hypothetical protein